MEDGIREAAKKFEDVEVWKKLILGC